METGFTIRAQGGWSIPLFRAYLQGGWSRFGVKADESDSGNGDLDVFEAGLGARFGLSFIWLGANGGYFFGDGADGFGFFPEIGVSLWRLELTADYRVDGSENWAGVWLAFEF